MTEKGLGLDELLKEKDEGKAENGKGSGSEGARGEREEGLLWKMEEWVECPSLRPLTPDT